MKRNALNPKGLNNMALWDYILFVCKDKKDISSTIQEMEHVYQKIILNKLLKEAARLPFTMNGTKIFCVLFDEYFLEDKESIRLAKKISREDPELFKDKMLPYRYKHRQDINIKELDFEIDVDIDHLTLCSVLEDGVVPRFNELAGEKCQITFIDA